MTEQWKAVVGYEGRYEVSDQGRVRSLNYRHTGKPRVMDGGTDLSGYPFVHLYRERVRKIHRVHRLVAEAFLFHDPIRRHINHKSGLKADNRLENLEWCNRSENMLHARDVLLTMPCGERHSNCTVSFETVQEIRRLFATGLHSQAAVGRIVGVSDKYVHRIISLRRRLFG